MKILRALFLTRSSLMLTDRKFMELMIASMSSILVVMMSKRSYLQQIKNAHFRHCRTERTLRCTIHTSSNKEAYKPYKNLFD